MLFIIAHHYVVNSGMIIEMAHKPFAVNSLFFLFFGAWGKTAINGFVMITGYFMCKSKITVRKFLKLVLQIEFYRVVIFFIFVISGYSNITLGSFLDVIIPVRNIGDGFTSAFIVFYLFIPFLNVLLHNIDSKMHLRLILLCLFLYTFLSTAPNFSVTMNYVSWFIVIYFLASYVRLYPNSFFEKTHIWVISALLSLLVSSCSILCCLYFGIGEYFFISDSNKILALVTAFCFFMVFKNVSIKYNKIINLIASASFGVLLIHANSDTMRIWLWKDTLKNAVVFNSQWCYVHFVCSVFGIYIVCTSIDLIRAYLIEKPFLFFYDSLRGH